ncbi:hypothetical protein CYMTET_22702 [Cymbomonas tetramitiformis]|uniref:Uncharacterized protein n=1 Tax=Cymbomonas tetramitiformis TaxID=36881 RepID=A0AAE0G081_9CHLO|nr:hypothetical protein CYMTET_22702 [Cymbomonas tetramitiformis]
MEVEPSRERYRVQHAKAQAARSMRTTQILGKFWQTQSGFLWQDLAVFGMLCGVVTVFGIIPLRQHLGADKTSDSSPSEACSTR